MDELIQVQVDEVLEMFEMAIEEKIDALKHRLASIRTGRANPSILDSVLVEYYGAKTPLNQIAGIATPDPQSITIKPYDRSALDSIVKAIFESDLGITPSNNGELVILNFPALTKERRIELVKEVKKLYNQYKDELNHSGRGAAKKGILAIDKLPEGDSKRILEDIDEMNRKAANDLKVVADEKEKEVTTL